MDNFTDKPQAIDDTSTPPAPVETGANPPPQDKVPTASALPEIEPVEPSTHDDIPLEPPALDEGVEYHQRPPRQNRHGGGGRNHGQGGREGREGRSPNFFRPRPSEERRHQERAPEKATKKEILVNCSPEETRVAVVEDEKLIELLVERTESEKIVGNAGLAFGCHDIYIDGIDTTKTKRTANGLVILLK